VGRRGPALLSATAVVLVSGLLAKARTPWAAERGLGRRIFDLPDGFTPVFEAAMQVGTLLAIVLVAASLVVAGRHRAAGAVALAGLGGWLAASGLKTLADRPRPSLSSLGRTPREVVETASWPSSHATVAFALATVVVLCAARGRLGRVLVVTAAGLAGIARIHLGVHWALDVAGGAGLGVAAGLLAVLVLRP
jgi:membrane-associated phospholipid phosphatase